MSDSSSQEERDPETLALYTEESLEGLQQVEELLLTAESGAAPKDFLGTLFRTVHTIKGTAGYLAYTRTQELSHKAEDLLSKMRDGKIKAGKEHFTCLIEVCDRLKQLVQNVKATNEEGDVVIGPLVERLKELMPEEGANTSAKPEPAKQEVAQTSPAAATEVKAIPPAVAAEAKIAPAEHVEPAETPKKEAKEAGTSDGTVQTAVDGQDGTVRVSVGVLDRLMDLIGELVLARNQMVQMVKTSTDGNVSTQSVFQRLNVVTSDLQEQVMKTRMQPVARVFEKIPRIVRDVCRVTSKQVNTIIEGNATEIDKALVEAIRDPVMHIVRNAIDHGIESEHDRVAASKPKAGSLYIRAAHKGGAVTIEVEDDGRGMDPANLKAHAIKKGIITQAEAAKLTDREAVDLVFRPGFSTAAQVSGISGRGVGMDVVRTHVERAGGKAEIESVVGKGTIIRLKMPLTMAIIPALLVRAKDQRFAIPQANLLELVYLTEEQRRTSIEVVRGAAIHKLRGEFIPLFDLSNVLGLSNEKEKDNNCDANIVILSSGSRRYSLVVDTIENTEEIVLKPLRGQLKRIPCYSGATVLGDGGVALILDVAGMAVQSGIDISKEVKTDLAAERKSVANSDAMMIFSVGGGVQCAVPLSMVARLEQVDKTRIEKLGGNEILQYRGEIVPIIRPERAIGVESPVNDLDTQLFIVFDFGERIAMAVEEVIDVADVERAEKPGQSSSQCVFSKTVAFGKTTLILDIYSIARDQVPHFGRSDIKQGHGQTVVTFLEAPALRGALESVMRADQINVVSCSTVEQVLAELDDSKGKDVSAVVLDFPGSPTSAYQLAGKLKSRRPEVQVINWRSQSGSEVEAAPGADAIDHSFQAGERDALVQFVLNLRPIHQTSARKD
jgi:two-component system chemotaxis sensor kinase CheA